MVLKLILLSCVQGHLGPIVSMAFDCTSSLLASGTGKSDYCVWVEENEMRADRVDRSMKERCVWEEGVG